MNDEALVFYHGTRRGFGPRGALLPRVAHGGPGTSAPVNPGHEPVSDAADWVYLTTNLDVAWAYAWSAPGHGKPKVLIVTPHGRLEPDPEHSPAMSAWRAEWASVTAVLTAPTIFETEARDGWQAVVETLRGTR